MNRFEYLLSVIDDSLRTKKKRHIIGGILFSVALLFAGLALTVFTIKQEQEEHKEWEKMQLVR